MQPPPRRSLPRSLRDVALAALVVTGLLALGSGPAPAAPVDDLRAQAKALESEINDNAEQLSALNEQIKFVQFRLDGAIAAIADAQARISVAKAETVRLQTLVGRRAAAIYRSASSGTPLASLRVDIRKVASRDQYGSAANARDHNLLRELTAAREDLALRQRDAEEAAQGAQAERAKLGATRADFQSAQAERQRLLDKVQGQIKTIVDQEAAARRAAQAPPPSFNPSTLPPPSGRGAVVVAFAQAQLGKPYEYAGVGPDSYDCSGLTMQAWAQVGISMPHNSEAQYAMFPRVPMTQLQPGDIVWTPGHVGIYVGGGAVIHAPHTGAVVSYQSVSYYQGAVRPG